MNVTSLLICPQAMKGELPSVSTTKVRAPAGLDRQPPLGGTYRKRMKSLILVLCLAFTVNSAEVAAGPTAEQLKTLATLLQEHHHRFTRQVTTPPFTETTAPTTDPPTPPDGSEEPDIAEPSIESIANFTHPACRKASDRIVQSCLVAHGLSVDDLSEGNSSYDERLQYYASRLSEIFCHDSRCQGDFFKFYEICIGSEVRWRITQISCMCVWLTFSHEMVVLCSLYPGNTFNC